MTIKEAIEQGIPRLRDPKWAQEVAYIKIDLLQINPNKPEFNCGPWFHLYEPETQKIMGEPTPQDMLFTLFDMHEAGWEAYTGPICEGDTTDVIVLAITVDFQDERG
jgi:hypothetical protein